MSFELAFNDFSFDELKNMVQTIAKTKKRSSDMMWTQGTNLLAIDDLEQNVDKILFEMVRRVQTQWSIERIQYNFSTSNQMLPNGLMNLFSITPSDLNHKIINGSIGASHKNGFDEIWVILNNTKYLMTHQGYIKIQPVETIKNSTN